MNPVLAQNIWSAPNNSPKLWIAIIATTIVGFLILAALTKIPPGARKLVTGALTFAAGAIYVGYFLWPTAQSRGPNDIPANTSETVAFFFQDAVGAVGRLADILTAFLLGLGIYSLVRIHSKRVFSAHRDRFFSITLLLAMVLMVVFGYMDWWDQKFSANATMMQFQEHWGFRNYAKDFLFDGLLQQMDAAMFSIIAFFILSAAYRAFRIRSIEATVLLATALIVMLGLMGAVGYLWNGSVDNMTHNDPASFLNNFKISEIAKWIQDTLQTAGIRALDFGIGLGALAMGLRLWLSLERGGVNA
jgi:uncharacterized membrane protein